MNTLSWSQDNTMLASGGTNQLHLWNVNETSLVRRFETDINDEILDIEFGFQGKILIVQTVEYLYFLRTDDLHEIIKYPYPVTMVSSTPVAKKLIAVDNDKRLATIDPNNGSTIVVWTVEYETLLAKAGITRQSYRAKSISLLGERESGCTNLARAITQQPFIKDHVEHPLNIHLLTLSKEGALGNFNDLQEIFVWDLPSHVNDYLSQHMHVNHSAVVIIMLQTSPGTLPLDKKNLDRWKYMLSRWRSVNQNRESILIPVISKCDKFIQKIDSVDSQFIADTLDTERVYVVSAKTGDGVTELTNTIISDISWPQVAISPSMDAFKYLETYTQQLRSQKRFLHPITELHKTFIKEHPVLKEIIQSSEDFRNYIKILEVKGNAYIFNHSDEILLDTTYFHNSVSAMISGADKDQKGMGRLPIKEAKRGYGKQLEIAESDQLDDQKQQQKLLSLTIEDMIERGITQEVSTDGLNYLVFPRSLTRIRNKSVQRPAPFASCHITGATEEIFASLLVRLLGQSTLYPDSDLWKDEAIFKTTTGGECGLIMKTTEEDEAELSLFFGEKTNSAEQSLFIKYIQHVLGIKQTISDSKSSSAAIPNEDIVKVFLSWHRKDKLEDAMTLDNIHKIVDLLEDHGIKTVNDPKLATVVTREEFKSLEKESRVALILLTGGRLNADQTNQYQRLKDAGCRIIPVVLPNAASKFNIPKLIKDEWEFFVDFRNTFQDVSILANGIKSAWNGGRIIEKPLDNHVFISYFREDFNKVSKLESKLRGAGHTVWWDENRLGPGSKLNYEFNTAIKSSYAFLLCISDETSKRLDSWVYRERDAANQIQRNLAPSQTFIIPVRLIDCPFPDLNIGVDTHEELKYFDFFGNNNDITNLVAALDNARRQVRHKK